MKIKNLLFTMLLSVSICFGSWSQNMGEFGYISNSYGTMPEVVNLYASEDGNFFLPLIIHFPDSIKMIEEIQIDALCPEGIVLSNSIDGYEADGYYMGEDIPSDGFRHIPYFFDGQELYENGNHIIRMSLIKRVHQEAPFYEEFPNPSHFAEMVIKVSAEVDQVPDEWTFKYRGWFRDEKGKKYELGSGDEWHSMGCVRLIDGIKGDIDNNETIDVCDVNELINVILGQKDVCIGCHLNGDRCVDVEDVNALINIILKVE